MASALTIRSLGQPVGWVVDRGREKPSATFSLECSTVPLPLICGRIHRVSPTRSPKEKEENKGIH